MYPLQCPNCGEDLEEPGAVIFWDYLPEKATAHIEQGEEGDVVVVLIDGAYEAPEFYLQCFYCGESLQFIIEGVFLDPEFEKIEIDE